MLKIVFLKSYKNKIILQIFPVTSHQMTILLLQSVLDAENFFFGFQNNYNYNYKLILFVKLYKCLN